MIAIKPRLREIFTYKRGQTDPTFKERKTNIVLIGIN